MSSEERLIRLVERAQAGDADAFALLIDEHRMQVVSACGRQLGDDGLAEDAVQEAALEAFRHLDALRQAERFGSWLTGIALNICRMWQRSRVQERSCWKRLAWIERIADQGPDAAPSPYSVDVRVSVREAVTALPSGQREAVTLFYLADRSYAETAQALGIETGAVRTRLFKARGALRERLRPVFEEEYMASDGEQKRYTCSFCKKSNEEVHRMIAGPGGVAICNECVDVCNRLIAEEEARQAC